MGDEREKWTAFLRMAEFPYNIVVHESMTASPVSWAYVRAPEDFPKQPPRQARTPNHLLEEAATRLARAAASLTKAHAAQKRHYDRAHQHEVLQAGDMVSCPLACSGRMGAEAGATLDRAVRCTEAHSPPTVDAPASHGKYRV
ncbi:hypothetical protein CSUI_009112, partial [Cystoisospora suis]